MNCAIYIDADNVSYKNLEQILSHSSNSNLIIKKIFADWTQESMKKWASRAKLFGFQGIQCFGNEYKQTSDIHMITDIINDLYTNRHIEMIILATSDIDFTHLCHIIKSMNKKLVVFTPQKTSLSNLVENENHNIKANKKEKINKKKNKKKKDNIDEKSMEDLNYLITAMGNNNSLYISEYKKNLKSILPNNKTNMDINHIDKELIKYPKHFGIIRKGNKVRIFGLVHILGYSIEDFEDSENNLQEEYGEILKNFDYKKILSL